jgi:hypothetical protein
MVPTIFDVIENFWGTAPLERINRSTRAELEDFGREVERFYSAYVPPPAADRELRTYFGRLVAVNFSLAGKRQTFFNNLLYCHSTIVPEPIARWYFDRYEELAKTPPADYLNAGAGASADQSEWIGWIFNSYRAFQWDLSTCREVLSYFVSGLLPLRPLVEAGIVVLVSQAHILLAQGREAVSSAMGDANDPEFVRLCGAPVDELPPLWDNVRGGHMTPGAGGQSEKSAVLAWARAKEAAYHIRKNLAIAGACGGIYVPENRTDFALLQRVLVMSGERLGYGGWEAKAARSVGELRIPSLEDLPLTELIALRKDEAAFEDFRLWLARRLLSLDTRAGAEPVELASAEMEAEVAELRSRLSALNVVKAHLRENGLVIAVSALVGVASGGGLLASAGGAVAVALAGILSSLHSKGQGAPSILAKLARMNRTTPDSIFGGSVITAGIPRPLARHFLGEFRTGPKPAEPTAYTPRHLRKVVEASMRPNQTGNPYRAIKG